MAYIQKTNGFSLFKNDKEGKSENYPDYSGEINVDGVLYFIDGWIKQGAQSKFLSGKIKKKENQATTTADGDEIPF